VILDVIQYVVHEDPSEHIQLPNCGFYKCVWVIVIIELHAILSPEGIKIRLAIAFQLRSIGQKNIQVDDVVVDLPSDNRVVLFAVVCYEPVYQPQRNL
jgi:hypothetical protein